MESKVRQHRWSVRAQKRSDAKIVAVQVSTNIQVRPTALITLQQHAQTVVAEPHSARRSCRAERSAWILRAPQPYRAEHRHSQLYQSRQARTQTKQKKEEAIARWLSAYFF